MSPAPLTIAQAAHLAHAESLSALLVAAPLVICLAAACLTLLLRERRTVQFAVSVLASLALLASGAALLWAVQREGVLALHAGGWRGPIGITLVADTFSALLVVLTACAGLAATLFQRRENDQGPPRPLDLPLTHVMLMGVCGAFLTGDLFNLYVWFEVLLMGSFVLLTSTNQPRPLAAGVPYVVLNLLSSFLFLAGAGLLYGAAGTLNFAHLSLLLTGEGTRPDLVAICVLLLLAFAIKGALFPLFFWLPASYHTPPFATSALFAALLTKVGLYSMFRLGMTAMPAQVEPLRDALAVVAGLSMIVGVLGAASQFEVRRILAFHSVSQMGYILMGLAIGTPAALAASTLFILHHALVKGNLFLIAGTIDHATGARTLKDPRLSGLAHAHPLLAAVFLVTALSLAGLPPFSGFGAKLAVISAGLDGRAHALTAVAILTGLFTLYSMVKIWGEGFWRPRPEGAPPPRTRGAGALLVVPAVLALAVLALGVFAGPLHRLCLHAGEQLADRAAYVRAVAPAFTPEVRP